MATGHHVTSATEIRDILICRHSADARLFTRASGRCKRIPGKLRACASPVRALLPIAALGVTVNFVLHELMHKFFAQRYGAIAEFRMFYTGLIITIFTSLFGFLLGMPGATMIYTQGSRRRRTA